MKRRDTKPAVPSSIVLICLRKHLRVEQWEAEAETQAPGCSSTAAGTGSYVGKEPSEQLQTSLAHLRWAGQTRNWLGLDKP